MNANCTIVSDTRNRGINSTILFRLFFSASFVVIICLGIMDVAVAQTNLEIPKRGEFKLDLDTLVVGELIVGDSATIVLTKPASMIKARRVVVGSGVQIIGIGDNGINGKNGRAAAPSKGVCKPGGNGEAGATGMAGGAGKDFTLDADQLTMNSLVRINLNGGNGGDGGKGGDGSQGSNSVSHCLSSGGNGGNGGSGGAGGRGGNVTLIIPSQTAAELTKLINLSNRGGYRGVGGHGGYPGPRGTGASKESKHGLLGKYGVDGITGKQGRSLFYSILKANDSEPLAMGIK